MKILYHHRTRARGAEGIHIREMIRAFRARGHEVVVCALAGGDPAEEQPGTEMQFEKGSRLGSIMKFMPPFAYELAEIAYNLPGRRRLVAAGRELKADFVYDRYNIYTWAGLKAARSLGVPHLLEVNSPVAYERSHYDGRNLVFERTALKYERQVFQRTDHNLAVSTPLRDYLLTLGVAPEQATVVPNGADPVKFGATADEPALRERYGMGSRTVIGFVGILRPWHGPELLLRAAARLDRNECDPHLLFVGDGPSEAEMMSLARELGFESRVTFAGRVPHDDVAAHIAAMDVTVSPKATFYASPMKILEYMAIGKAVVAPDMPNIRDIFEAGEEGLLFREEDEDSLYEVLDRVCRERELRERLGRNARVCVETRRNWDANARIVESIAEPLIMAARAT